MPTKANLTIVKIGGQLLEDQAQLQLLLEKFSALPGAKILVHGGGRKASQIAEQLQVKVQLVEGRRITDKAMLEVATMVYAGWYSKNLVSQLQGLGCNALGLCGADLNCIEARKRPVGKIDYGWVGDIHQINTEALLPLLQANICPVFSAITHDGQQQLLNTNADTIAASLAMALTPFYHIDLRFCFELPGVLAQAEPQAAVLAQLDSSTYQKLKAMGIISGGMIPKLDNAFAALRQKVKSIAIGNPSTLFNQQSTQLCL